MPELQNILAGTWRPSASPERIAVINPATGALIGHAPAGSAADVDRAVSAARDALGGWAATPVAERAALLARLRDGLAARSDEIAGLITDQMGTPLGFSKAAQMGLPLRNFDITLAAASAIGGEEAVGRSTLMREPVGVVAAITPWNFPLHQIVAKIVPALLAGCTLVLKPSELTPFDAAIVGEEVVAAGFPAGVFNIIFGGAETGAALVGHPDVAMVSFTGSTRAGRAIGAAAGGALKKVALELGGKSANILLDDADFAAVVPQALGQCFVNAGQTCAALTRLLVPEGRKEECEMLALAEAARWQVGDPRDPATMVGPLASTTQQRRVFAMIDQAVAEGARLLCGGSVQPDGLPDGAYVRPTILADVTPDMVIAREEVFGPVLAILTYEDEEDAVRIANDSFYGLSGGVWSSDERRAADVARRIRTGQVMLNGAMLDLEAPFGGVGNSGIGREYGRYAIEEFFTLKAITRPAAA
jgi:acyl-CoA reductase-like NAD-dependent aldehyde dehydrogenase